MTDLNFYFKLAVGEGEDMACFAIITAGGVGLRVGCEKPKQFIEVFNKPLIIYTLEKFQNNKNISKIIVPCVIGYEQELNLLKHKYGITKLMKIVQGGKTGFDSIYNALQFIKNYAVDDDIIVIHDGNRPNVSDKIINENVLIAQEKGNCITSLPVSEVVYDVFEGVPKLLNRDNLRKVQTPISGLFKELFFLYETAMHEGHTNLQGYCSLLSFYNRDIYFCNGSEENIKITYPEDFKVFTAMRLLAESNLKPERTN